MTPYSHYYELTPAGNQYMQTRHTPVPNPPGGNLPDVPAGQMWYCVHTHSSVPPKEISRWDGAVGGPEGAKSL